MFDFQGFEDRHPFVRSILRAVTVDSINHGAAVALRFEDAAKQLAIVLPDGPALQELLTAVQAVQSRAVAAVDMLLTPVNEDNSAPAPAAALSIPGRDHPITAPAPGTVTTAEPDSQPPAPDAPAEAPEPAVAAPAEPVADSGPLGAAHADTEPQTVS